jgi:capsular polysaccharide biosynthesis protein
MMSMLSILKKHILPFLIITLLVLAVSASYYRFVVINDFLVSYEGFCDTSSESCFAGSYYDEKCECDITYNYKYVTKTATVYKKQMAECDNDPYLDPMYCEEVNHCTQDEDNCTIEYCDTKIDGNSCSE